MEAAPKLSVVARDIHLHGARARLADNSRYLFQDAAGLAGDERII